MNTGKSLIEIKCNKHPDLKIPNLENNFAHHLKNMMNDTITFYITADAVSEMTSKLKEATCPSFVIAVALSFGLLHFGQVSTKLREEIMQLM